MPQYTMPLTMIPLAYRCDSLAMLAELAGDLFTSALCYYKPAR